jgi:hypothetical protein
LVIKTHPRSDDKSILPRYNPPISFNAASLCALLQPPCSALSTNLSITSLPRQRLLRAAAHMGLPFLDDAAVPERGTDMAGVISRIGIVWIDHEFHLGSERKHPCIADGTFREGAEPDTAMD